MPKTRPPSYFKRLAKRRRSRESKCVSADILQRYSEAHLRTLEPDFKWELPNKQQEPELTVSVDVEIDEPTRRRITLAEYSERHPKPRWKFKFPEISSSDDENDRRLVICESPTKQPVESEGPASDTIREPAEKPVEKPKTKSRIVITRITQSTPVVVPKPLQLDAGENLELELLAPDEEL